jgi:Ni/Fe-hydrogenase 1 B-type cytochrome subunit
MMFAMIALAVTGYFIGSPLPSVGGEASEHFLMGYIRFVHFAAGYVFTIFFVLRVYWAFVGNRYSRELFFVPFKIFTWEFWSGLFDLVLYYLFVHEKRHNYLGHNPLALLAMFFMYVLGAVFMIFTGLALYGEGTGMGSWQYGLFTSWVMPLLGGSQAVHTWHHLCMWYLLIFALVHMYMVVREDIYLKVTVVSSMISGWRVPRP